jgi:putative MATE family efflux protein
MTFENFKKMFFMKLPSDVSKKQLRNDIIKIAWPSLVELILVQLCTIIDNMMVGNLGSTELASVAYCTQPKFLLLCTFIALNAGTTAIIARFKGMGERENAVIALRQSILLSLFLSLIISIIGYIFSEDMVIFMGAETSLAVKYGTEYMRIQMLGFVFNALCLSITAGLRGIGQTKVSMYYNMGANIINVIFNYCLIYGNFGFPKLGVAGASAATAIGQTIACFAAFFTILKKDSYLRYEIKKAFKIDFKMIKRILNIGIPSMFEQFFLRFGLIVYALTVSSLGEKPFTAHQICLNIMGVSFMNGQAFGISATSLIGQSLGKNRPDMAYSYAFLCRKYGMFISIILGIFLLIFASPIMGLFTKDDFIISAGVSVMIFLALNQPFQSSQLVISGALRGAGDTAVVAVSTLIGVLLIRPITSIIAVKYLGLWLQGAWASVVIDQIIRCIIVFLRFGSGKWTKIKV